MHIRSKRLMGLGAVLTLGALAVVLTTFASAASGSAQHVSWAIISVSPLPITPPPPAGPVTFNPGGVATALTPEGNVTITLTGSGAFVAPSGKNGGSGAVTGGGSWSISGGGGSGTYEVKELVSWTSAGAQTLPAGRPVIDNTGDTTERTNGVAVLRIEYNDGSQGVLTVGCHGPGAPAGIFEGIAVTKGFTTYYTVPAPLAAVDVGRTIFHVRS